MGLLHYALECIVAEQTFMMGLSSVTSSPIAIGSGWLAQDARMYSLRPAHPNVFCTSGTRVTRNIFYKGQGYFQLVLSLVFFPSSSSLVPSLSLISPTIGSLILKITGHLLTAAWL